MRSEAPALLPIFRTRAPGEILALGLQDPEQEWTISELARATGAPLTSTRSEIARLESGDPISSRKVGRTRLVHANAGNPVTAPLSQVVMLTFGPQPVIANEFAHLGARRVLIFGSWAARLLGKPGAGTARKAGEPGTPQQARLGRARTRPSERVSPARLARHVELEATLTSRTVPSWCPAAERR